MIAVSGRFWPLVPMAIDFFLYVSRMRLRRGRSPIGREPPTAGEYLSAWLNLSWFALIALDIHALCQLPSDRAAILGLILATGVSDVARPFAFLSIGLAIGFLLLLRRTHANLLGAIRAQRESHFLAMHDPLTKLPNRVFTRGKLAALLSGLGTPSGPSALCLDLDGFKQVNDRYGHAAGDRVLIHVAGILCRTLRAGDIASRIGGGEYVIVLPDATGERARSVAQCLFAELMRPIDIGRAMPAFVGGSIGAAIADKGTRELDEPLRPAGDDQAAA